MTSEKLEYDYSLGGPVTLPGHIQTYHYADARVSEIRQLLASIQEPTSNKLVFQSLPKHMRRRAMSHHPKRLPRRYRNAHKSQMLKAGKPQQTKRPSRKFRRKANNLLKEYIRRQRKHVWLETHIWHAKRFHMVDKWGYKLPFASCDKTYRACYRATTKHCLIQDISFYGCIELRGDIDSIKEGFAHLTSIKCGFRLSITAKAYTAGKREGSIHLFRANQYPRGALTKVNFIWKPAENIMEVARTVWIFVHPSAYREVLEEIIKVFKLVSTRQIKVPIQDDSSAMQVDDDTQNNKGTKSETQLKFMTKTFAYSRAPQYENKKTGMILKELKDMINRFRLTGPLSQAVLAHALKCKTPGVIEPENWFKEYLQSDKSLNFHRKQMHFWDNCKSINSPGQLTTNMIINLNVEDPRINRPQKRSKALPVDDSIDDGIFYELPEELSQSPLWDFDLRNKLIEKMMPAHELCTMRNKHAVVPGQRCIFENDLQPVPVLLIQRPGSQNNSYKRLGYSCGWDIIIPSGYGMSFWLSFIMWGAKPGGLRELNSINRESGQELNLPDTVSGKKETAERYAEMRCKYFRLPSNKRCNYRKLSICSPFRPLLAELSQEWTGGTNDFFILRERDVLENLSISIKKNLALPTLPRGCLIPICLKMKTRGKPGDYSIVCLPKKNDLKCYWKKKKMFSKDPIYTEPLKPDETECERKTLRLQHKRLLKRLRNKRVREKRKLQESSDRKVRIRPAKTTLLVAEQFKKMCELWLPEETSTVRYQCKREVFGYVTQSAFSFTEATVTGIGYITIEGLHKLLQICGKAESMVLVRDTKSRHYRFASFKINCQI